MQTDIEKESIEVNKRIEEINKSMNENQKVWCVFYSELDKKKIVGVFSSKEKADNAAKKFISENNVQDERVTVFREYIQ